MAKKTSVKTLKPNNSKIVLERKTSRKLRSAKYQSFKLAKRIKHPDKVTSSFKVAKKSLKVVASNWKLFLGITLIYSLLTIVLVRGIGGGLDVGQIKSVLRDAAQGSANSVSSAFGLFALLLGTSGTASSAGGSVYQSILLVVISLAVIWSMRQILAGKKLKIRDAFYQGMYPMIPFILVLLVIGLQLIPLLAGSWLYSTIISNGIAVTTLEKFVWLLIFLLLALLSLYMIASSLFALYIVTLPDMAPIKALRSARQLVLYRRWQVIRKLLFLPFALLVAAAAIMIPTIIFAAVVAQWIFFVLTMAVIVVIHAYMYTLYRELL